MPYAGVDSATRADTPDDGRFALSARRLATVFVDECPCEAVPRPIHLGGEIREWIAGNPGKANRAGLRQRSERQALPLSGTLRLAQLGDYAPVISNQHMLPGLDEPEEMAELILEIANADGDHPQK
jgi:hypothetical protein